MTNAGVVLSQPPISTAPSTECERIVAGEPTGAAQGFGRLSAGHSVGSSCVSFRRSSVATAGCTGALNISVRIDRGPVQTVRTSGGESDRNRRSRSASHASPLLYRNPFSNGCRRGSWPIRNNMPHGRVDRLSIVPARSLPSTANSFCTRLSPVIRCASADFPRLQSKYVLTSH